jgi:hypothetical protein
MGVPVRHFTDFSPTTRRNGAARAVWMVMKGLVAALALMLCVSVAHPAAAASCAGTGTGFVPIPDLGTRTYEGAQGGLYPDGTNQPSRDYAAAGVRADAQITPRAPDGRADPNGKVVLLSIGMSNTTQEFSTFVRLAQTDAARAANVLVVDGAQGGRDAAAWTSADAQAWVVVEDRLRAAGATAQQVQAVWVKQALKQAGGSFESHVGQLERDLGTIVENAAARYPNLRQVFLSPRTYGGYAATALNPEPYAYQSGFAVKRVVESSVRTPDARPWIGWGPYLWADGTTANASGLSYSCADFVQDGTHPSGSGRMKVATELQKFFGGSTFTTWYRGEHPSPPASVPRSVGATDETLPFFEPLLATVDDDALPVRAMLAGLGVLWLALATVLLIRAARHARE